MNNISLKRLSITVVVASLASNIVFANNDISTVLTKAEKPSSFAKLISKYDSDKSNTLSAKELANNDKLSKDFAKVDVNGDKQISEKEFNNYLESMKKSLS